MKRTIRRVSMIAVLAALLMALVVPGTALAGDNNRTPRYTDEVGLLTASQVSMLTAKLDEISKRHQFDVVISITDSTDNKSPRLYAADFFEEHDFGYGKDGDGIILMLAMRERDFAFVTKGYGKLAFTDAGQEYMEKLFLPSLKNDDYFDAFLAFADAADDFLEKAKAGNPYNSGNIPMTPGERQSARLWTVIISIAIAFIVPGIVVAVWTSQLKSVRRKDHAADYIRRGSMQLTMQRDIFLHRNVSRTARQQSDSSGGSSGSFRSSSGGSFSGRSGKF